MNNLIDIKSKNQLYIYAKRSERQAMPASQREVHGNMYI